MSEQPLPSTSTFVEAMDDINKSQKLQTFSFSNLTRQILFSMCVKTKNVVINKNKIPVRRPWIFRTCGADSLLAACAT